MPLPLSFPRGRSRGRGCPCRQSTCREDDSRNICPCWRSRRHSRWPHFLQPCISHQHRQVPRLSLGSTRRASEISKATNRHKPDRSRRSAPITTRRGYRFCLWRPEILREVRFRCWDCVELRSTLSTRISFWLASQAPDRCYHSPFSWQADLCTVLEGFATMVAVNRFGESDILARCTSTIVARSSAPFGSQQQVLQGHP